MLFSYLFVLCRERIVFLLVTRQLFLPRPVNRPDLKGFPTFSHCTEFPPHTGFELMFSRSEVRRSN
jgi:hypothetical protein